MAGTWIQTLSNKRLEPRHLAPESVGPITEIAHSLAGNFRFTRQTDKRYSVAEHCVRGSLLLAPVFAGAFLLHELSEVYLPDIPSPLKPHVLVSAELPGESPIAIPWETLERQHTRAILTSLNLLSLEPLIYCPEVKHMDLAMLAAEKVALFGTHEPEAWDALVGVEPAETAIEPWEPERAEHEFLTRFVDLFYTLIP